MSSAKPVGLEEERRETRCDCFRTLSGIMATNFGFEDAVGWGAVEIRGAGGRKGLVVVLTNGQRMGGGLEGNCGGR